MQGRIPPCITRQRIKLFNQYMFCCLGFDKKVYPIDKSALYPISSGIRGGGMRVVAHNVSHSVSHLK